MFNKILTALAPFNKLWVSILTALAPFNKLWVSIVPALGVVLFVVAPTETEALWTVTESEWYLVLLAFAGSVGVFSVPNIKK